MARSTGIVLATGGLVLANELFFMPLNSSDGLPAAFGDRFNWRVIPATGILALVLGGIEKAAPGFAVGLASLALLSVLIVPYGNAGTPIENLAKTIGGK